MRVTTVAEEPIPGSKVHVCSLEGRIASGHSQALAAFFFPFAGPFSSPPLVPFIFPVQRLQLHAYVELGHNPQHKFINTLDNSGVRTGAVVFITLG